MKFRNDISFLRAFSVIAVLLYHYNIQFFQGGFVGVDIFFVISGYLMTKIILDGYTSLSFSYLNFLKKRINRIIPALLFLLISVLITVYFIIPTQFINTAKNAYSSSLFFSNIFYYLNNGYFDSASRLNFFLHTWSLSVEWQFYMIYPLILYLLRNYYLKKLRIFKLFYTLIILLSILLMLYHSKNDSSYSFYIFYTRAWEMLLGGLSFIFTDRLKKIPDILKKILVYLAITTLFICVYKLNHTKNIWPSLLSIIPVLSTSLILLFNVDLKLFKFKIVKFFSDISYSLYLWHWPLYVYLVFFNVNDIFKYKIAFILLSIILAIISYFIIEKQQYKNKEKYFFLASLLLFVINFSLVALKANIFRSKKNNNLSYYSNYYKYSNSAIMQYSMGINHLSYNMDFKEYKFKPPVIDKKNIILLGDSHAGMLSFTLNKIANSNKFNIIQITGDATFPLVNSKSKFKGPIQLFNNFFNTYFPMYHKHIDLVVISANYADYFNNEEEFKLKINSLKKYFNNYNVKILFLGQTERYIMDYPTSYSMGVNYKIKYRDNLNKNYQDENINTILIEYLKNDYVDLLNVPKIKMSKDGVPFIYDEHHYTIFGTNQLKSLLNEKITTKLN